MLKVAFLIGVLAFVPSALADLLVSTADASIRAPIPGMKNTVGYMQLTNQGAEPITLIAASSAASKKLEFHNHEMANGVMRMYQVPQVVIEPGATVTFESGGLHLMFLQVEPSLTSAKLIEVTFETQSGDSFVVPFQVQSIKMKHNHH